jgi:LEM3 (ligand-effect modulator 3) family / CDC50 family
MRASDYPVVSYHATKSLVFSTVSFIGGRNPFLGIAYIATGGVCLVIGLLLALRHLIRPRKVDRQLFNVTFDRLLMHMTTHASLCSSATYPTSRELDPSFFHAEAPRPHPPLSLSLSLPADWAGFLTFELAGTKQVEQPDEAVKIIKQTHSHIHTHTESKPLPGSASFSFSFSSPFF